MIYSFNDYIKEKYTGNTKTKKTTDGGKSALKATVKATSLNLRKSPTTKASNVIEKLPNGTQVTITGSLENGFYPVSYNGETGYLHSKYLVVGDKEASDSEADKSTASSLSVNPKRDVVQKKGAGTPDCAAYVRKCFQQAGKLVDGVVGNAWGFFMNLGGGVVFNVYDQLAKNNKKAIEDIAVEINKTKKDDVKADGANIGAKYPAYKDINAKIKNVYPASINLDLSKVQQYDLVGMFYSKSENHVRAFDEAAFRRSGYMGRIFNNSPVEVDGDTATLEKPFTFNTHLGFVSEIKDGIPYVEHNIHGKVHVTPMTIMLKKNNPSDLMVAWVKRAG